jgi:anion-transporting  ArsA/GET3 family ATPase
VTGKGGVGKTTVAGGLALAAAARGRSALVCGGQGPLPAGVPTLRVEPEAALAEWLSRHLGGPATALLQRSHAFGYFVAAAPGAAEMVTIGKVVDLARGGGYDSVIVDAPATGHALALLAAPRTFAELARTGPVTREAAEVERWLADPANTAYVGVAAPEPMAVEELSELQAALPALVGHGLDLVVVDAVHPDRFSDDDARRLQAAADGGPGRALLEAVLVEHRRARREAEQVRRARALIDAPVVTIPFVFGVSARRTPAPAAPTAGEDRAPSMRSAVPGATC